eukprot:EC816017.1.p1 GENE.EC816017.1~~EC816017.1.p1  ORF type:complete len:160 (+),score=45.28 EC816017.1:1-480(+)
MVTCTTGVITSNTAIPDASSVIIDATIDCPNILSIENVVLSVTLAHQRRGDVQINLISPSKTSSPVALARPPDTSSDGLQAYPFKSTHFWGESVASGTWSIKVFDVRSGATATLNSYELIVYASSKNGSAASIPRPQLSILAVVLLVIAMISPLCFVLA